MIHEVLSKYLGKTFNVGSKEHEAVVDMLEKYAVVRDETEAVSSGLLFYTTTYGLGHKIYQTVTQSHLNGLQGKLKFRLEIAV